MLQRNVLDKYREWETDLIRDDVKKNTFPYAVLMEHWEGDFNIGTLIRNANAFGAKEVFYRGQKHINKRGTVGTHNYTSVKYLSDDFDLKDLKWDYSFVAFECNIKAKSLPDFIWPKNPLLLFGEETCGLNKSVLDLADHIVAIPQYGSVRSLNVGVASGIAMNDFISKYNKNLWYEDV